MTVNVRVMCVWRTIFARTARLQLSRAHNLNVSELFIFVLCVNVTAVNVASSFVRMNDVNLVGRGMMSELTSRPLRNELRLSHSSRIAGCRNPYVVDIVACHCCWVSGDKGARRVSWPDMLSEPPVFATVLYVLTAECTADIDSH